MSIIDKFGINVLDIGRTFNDSHSDWTPTTMANGDQAYFPYLDGYSETFDNLDEEMGKSNLHNAKLIHWL